MVVGIDAFWELIFHHLCYERLANQTLAIQFSAIEYHLTETEVITRRTHQAATPRLDAIGSYVVRRFKPINAIEFGPITGCKAVYFAF